MHPVPLAPRIADQFPGLVAMALRIEGLTVTEGAHPPAEALQRKAEHEVRARRTAEGLKEDPLFRAYRDFYWRLGIDPTKTRPAGEALNRRVLNGNALPGINAFVDAYNAASLLTGVPVGAYDAAALKGPLVLRAAEPGEPFQGIPDPEPRPLAGGELVLADAARVVNFYPYRDAHATRITGATRSAVVVACGAPGVPEAAVAEAARLAAANVVTACGGRVVATP